MLHFIMSWLYSTCLLQRALVIPKYLYFLDIEFLQLGPVTVSLEIEQDRIFPHKYLCVEQILSEMFLGFRMSDRKY